MSTIKKWLTVHPRFGIFIIILSAFQLQADELSLVELDDNNFILVDTYLDKDKLLASLDSYIFEDKLLIAVKPLFNSLTLRYQHKDNELVIWKELSESVYTLKNTSSNKSSALWADDGYNLYVDNKTLSELFNITIKWHVSNQTLDLTTSADYKFPSQKLVLLAKQRIIAQSNKGAKVKASSNANIIPDQYRLATIPHGMLSLKATSNDKKNNSFGYSVQTESDLLYHSASLTLNQQSKNDVNGRLTLSRYKLTPDDLIFGAFDKYQLGDVSGGSNNLTTNSQSGLGLSFSRATDSYRNRDTTTSIIETAPPGWTAELYRNGRFIELKEVPADGNLLFEDVETQYGNNHYEIKLYGAYGEEIVKEKYLQIKANALSEGQLSYNFYGLDKNNQVIKQGGSAPYEFTDFGLNIDYGITNSWSLGLSVMKNITSDDESLDYIVLKNSLSLPGLLFNNETSLQKNQGYAQLSTLSGQGFGKDRFAISIQSSDNFNSSRISAEDLKDIHVGGNYYLSLGKFSSNFGIQYNKSTSLNQESISSQFKHRISARLFGVSMTNSLIYSQNDNTTIIGNSVNELSSDNWSGNVSAAGKVLPGVNSSVSLQYNLQEKNKISNASVSLRWRTNDDQLFHNLQGRYNVQSATTNKWQLAYNLSLNHKKFGSNLSFNYNALGEWQVGLGLQLFFSYDYHQNNILMSGELSSNSASINTYSYLDRNPNGWRDESDWDLAGVQFTGHRAWKEKRSDENGRMVLPGVSANSPFNFNAYWENGTQTIKQNYTIYTHPGAYVDVNMPFYVTTEVYGGVEQETDEGIINSLSNVLMELTNESQNTQTMISTDSSGYFEIKNLLPGNYSLKVSDEYLTTGNFTSKVIGYQFTTSRTGGSIDLETIILNTKTIDGKKQNEDLLIIKENNSNYQENIWYEKGSVNNGQIYTAPATQEVRAQKKYSEPDVLRNAPIERTELPEELTNSYIPQQVIDQQNLQPVNEVIESTQQVTTVNEVEPRQTDIEDNQVVIQLLAQRTKDSLMDEANRFNKLGNLYIAEKQVNNEVWYCLISRGFLNNVEAQNALNQSGLTGWILSSTTYSNIIEIN